MEIQLSPQEKIKEKKIIPVILCAGEGTRYGPLTQSIPKPAIELKSLNNKSILSYLIGNLLTLHLKDIVIITGYLNEKIESSIQLLHKNRSDVKINFIHAGDQYKKGPLFSLLSIIQNKCIYTENNIFIIFPGDTIFEVELLKEVFDFINNNIDLISTEPCIFFQEIYDLDEYNRKNRRTNPKFVSIMNSEDIKNEIKIKEIKKIDLGIASTGQPMKIIVPIVIFNFEFIGILYNLSMNNTVGEIREALNIYLKQDQKILPIKLNQRHRFYDIDTPDDLNDFNKIDKEKKGGQ